MNIELGNLKCVPRAICTKPTELIVLYICKADMKTNSIIPIMVDIEPHIVDITTLR